MLVPLLAMMTGLVLADITGTSVPFPFVVSAYACLLISCRIPHRAPSQILYALFFFILGLHMLIPWQFGADSQSNVKYLAGRDPVLVEGVVATRPVNAETGGTFVLNVLRSYEGHTARPVRGTLMVYVTSGDILVMRGDLIRFSTRITVPHRLGLPGEFDFPRFLRYQGVTAIGRTPAAENLVLIRGAAHDSLFRHFDLVARQLGDFIRASIHDRGISSVVTAVLIGDQKRIPPKVADEYTRAGVNHILSISGFHIGIIAYFVVMIMLALLSRSETLALRIDLRRFALLLTLPAMFAYLLITGAAPATSRSVVMLATYTLALYVERESDTINALLLAAFILLCLNPTSLFDLSFQLSFLALWGISVATPAISAWTGRFNRRWLIVLLQFVLISTIASLVTLVPVLYYFGQASLSGILSNFLIVPLLGYGAVLAGFVALPLVYIMPAAAHGLLHCAAMMTDLSNRMVAWFARIPLVEFRSLSVFDVGCFLLFMCVVTFVRHQRLRTLFCLCLPLCAVAAHLNSPSGGDGRLHVTMLSVGQAESLFIRLPDGSNMLVDGGGYLHDTGLDFGQRTLAPALRHLGVRRIDRMVLTHSHPDHCGGLAYLVRSMPVAEFWQPVQGTGGNQYEQLVQLLRSVGTPVRSLAAGDRIDLTAAVNIEILSPQRPSKDSHRIRDDEMAMNEVSLVFRLTYGNFSMLFTADAGFESEARIMRERREIRATILKVGHHGSRYSTSLPFLEAVSPRAAVISAGRNNRFGLPAEETLGFLARRSIEVWRTDRDGTIEIVSDGKNWEILTPFRQQLDAANQ